MARSTHRSLRWGPTPSASRFGTRYARPPLGLKAPARETDPAGSDGHQVLFFPLHRVVHFLDVGVGEVLDLFEGALLVVLGDILILEELLQPVVHVAAHLANRRAALLGDLPYLLP